MLMSMANLNASAYAFEVNGIYYNYNSDIVVSYNTFSVSVTFGAVEYQGDIAIPEEVIYKGRTLSVTRIGDGAFAG